MTPEIIELAVKAIIGLLAIGGLWLVSYAKAALKARAEVAEASELLFDVVTIDRKKRKIYTTRIGAGDHREFDY